MAVSKLQAIGFLYYIKKPGKIFEQESDIVKFLLQMIASWSTIQVGKNKKLSAYPCSRPSRVGDRKAETYSSRGANYEKYLMWNQIHI